MLKQSGGRLPGLGTSTEGQFVHCKKLNYLNNVSDVKPVAFKLVMQQQLAYCFSRVFFMRCCSNNLVTLFKWNEDDACLANPLLLSVAFFQFLYPCLTKAGSLFAGAYSYCRYGKQNAALRLGRIPATPFLRTSLLTKSPATGLRIGRQLRLTWTLCTTV